jgi:predicted GNAT superfamily acetyltransferase
MSDSDISIRPFQSWVEFLAAEELQRSIWHMPDWREAVPANLLITVHKNGGVTLGAFDGKRMVGFVFGFIGSELQKGVLKLKHCSHMLAVLPEYQSRKIGARLKFAQRSIVLAQHIDLITWTYDPLQAVNAKLNLVRLGAFARRYIKDAYGDMSDGLNAGLASDRFQVEWWLDAPNVIERASHERKAIEWDALVQLGAQQVFTIKMDEQGFPHIEGVSEARSDKLLVEIPAHIGEIKATRPDLAREWRKCTRDIFIQIFSSGYIANDFVFVEHGNAQRAAYVLTRSSAATGLST